MPISLVQNINQKEPGSLESNKKYIWEECHQSPPAVLGAHESLNAALLRMHFWCYLASFALEMQEYWSAKISENGHPVSFHMIGRLKVMVFILSLSFFPLSLDI